MLINVAPTDVIRVYRNAAESALLSLPQEVKNAILREVFGGGRLLHIKNAENESMIHSKDDWLVKKSEADNSSVYPPNPWLTSFCFTSTIHNEAFQSWGTTNSSDTTGSQASGHLTEQGLRRRRQRKHCAIHSIPHVAQSCSHLCWSPGASTDFEDFHAPREPVDLRVLRASRQLYQEANPLIWKTPVFSFSEAYSFIEFIKNRKLAQKRLLQKLHIQGGIGRNDDKFYLCHSWGSTNDLPLVKPLVNLRELELSFTDSGLALESFERLHEYYDTDIINRAFYPFFTFRYHAHFRRSCKVPVINISFRRWGPGVEFSLNQATSYLFYSIH